MGLKRLTLNKETLRSLTETQMLRGVAGGALQPDISGIPTQSENTYYCASVQCTQSSNAQTMCHCG